MSPIGNSINVGSLLCINLNEVSLIDCDLCGLCVDGITIGHTSDRGEDHVEFLSGLFIAIFEFHS